MRENRVFWMHRQHEDATLNRKLCEGGTLMGKRMGRTAVLGSLITAGALCLSATTAQAQAASISLSSASGVSAGETISLTATLQDPGVDPGVAGAQNDLGYDSSKVAVVVRPVCASDPLTECTTDQECIDASGDPNDKCGLPDCTVNTDIRKEATKFGFLPAGCSGSACNGVRALIFSLTSPNRLIPDGSDLYSCNVVVAQDAPDGTYDVTVSNVILGYPSPPGGQVCGSESNPCGATSGSVTVGMGGGPTPTPTLSGPGIIGGSTATLAGTTASVDFTLIAPDVTPGVAGAQADIGFDPAIIPVVVKPVCVSDPLTECTTDQECIDASGDPNDKCGIPDCTVNADIRKEATKFGFLPAGCSGSECNGVRALIFSLTSPNRLIPDNSVLFSCNFAVAPEATGENLISLTNVILGFPSPPGGQVCGSESNPCGAAPGRICIGESCGGPVSATPTPTTAEAASPTPTGTSVPPTPTNTVQPPTHTPTAGVPPITGFEDSDGCQIATPGSAGPVWLLLIPAVGLLVLRRRSR
jgi:hypothetical protein